MFLLALSKGYAVIAIIALIAVLAVYKLITLLADKPNEQRQEIDMLKKRLNRMEIDLTQTHKKLDQLIEQSQNNDIENHD